MLIRMSRVDITIMVKPPLYKWVQC
jgi:hypothetical protein